MITRRTAAKGGLFGLATALSGIVSGMAKDNNGGFGATASVSVNSGNNSGNQTFQENQAILTENAAGQISVQQGNAAGDATVQQGSVQTSPAILPRADGATPPDCGCGNDIPPECEILTVSVGNGPDVNYIPFACLQYYCQRGS